MTHLCGAVRASQLRQRQVEQKVHAEAGRRYGSGTCARKRPHSLGSSAAMNREDHYYPSQVFKDSCAYQRSQGEDYSHSPPPCLYMNRQVHSVYTPPSMGALEQASLPDIAPSYSLPSLRDDPVVPQLHHPQGLQQQALQPTAGYGDTVEQSRYHLPFPWMKTTKSHSHTWKGQWAGKLSKPSTNVFCFKTQRRESLKRDLLLFYNIVTAYQNTWIVLFTALLCSHSTNLLSPAVTSRFQQYGPGCFSLPCQSICERPGRSALSFIRTYRHKNVGFVSSKHFS